MQIPSCLKPKKSVDLSKKRVLLQDLTSALHGTHRLIGWEEGRRQPHPGDWEIWKEHNRIIFVRKEEGPAIAHLRLH